MNAPLAKEQIALLMADSLTYRTSPVQGTAAAASRPSFVAKLAQGFGRMVQAMVALPRRRAVLDELSMLSDRELADIGLSRPELRLVFDPAFARNRRS